MWLFFSNHQNCATLNYPRRYSPLNSSCALPPTSWKHATTRPIHGLTERRIHQLFAGSKEEKKERKNWWCSFLRLAPHAVPGRFILPRLSRWTRGTCGITTLLLLPPLLPPHSPVPISNLIIDDEMARDDCVWSHPRNAHKRPRTVTTNPRGGLPGPGMIGWPALGQWPVLVRWLARLACSNAIGFFSLSLSLLRPYSGVVVFYLRHVSLSLLFPTRYSLCWSERFLPPPHSLLFHIHNFSCARHSFEKLGNWWQRPKFIHERDPESKRKEEAKKKPNTGNEPVCCWLPPTTLIRNFLICF